MAWSERNFLTKFDAFAVSLLLKETAQNTAQTLSHAFGIDEDTLINLERRREPNSDELTGVEGATKIYDYGALSGVGVKFSKMQVQHLLWALAFGGGDVATASLGTGYKHTITEWGLGNVMKVPTFTTAMKYSKVFKRRFMGMGIDNFSLTMAKSDKNWINLAATVKGTGKYDDNLFRESITAAWNATSLTLAANAVQGSTAANRLANVHRIIALDPTVSNKWVDVTYSAVSAATPAIITISAPGGVVTSTTYIVEYLPAAVAWETFPAEVIESPLRFAAGELIYKPLVDASTLALTAGSGHEHGCDIQSLEWTVNNQLVTDFCFGGADTYADRITRGEQKHAIKVNREAQDAIMELAIKNNDYPGLLIQCQGDEFAASEGNYYLFKIWFPKVGFVGVDKSKLNQYLGENLTLEPLYDSTAGYRFKAIVQNKIATAAA